MDKPLSYYAFEILYWCGIREGELLALTPADFDLDKGLLSITKILSAFKRQRCDYRPQNPEKHSGRSDAGFSDRRNPRLFEIPL